MWDLPQIEGKSQRRWLLRKKVIVQLEWGSGQKSTSVNMTATNSMYSISFHKFGIVNFICSLSPLFPEIGNVKRVII